MSDYFPTVATKTDSYNYRTSLALITTISVALWSLIISASVYISRLA